MKRILVLACSFLLLISLVGCRTNGIDGQHTASPAPPSSAGTRSSGQMDANSSGTSTPIQNESAEQAHTNQLIRITTKEKKEIVFRINDSPAAHALYQQLPFSIEIEDYAASEKIFYPPQKLETNGTPMAQGPVGTLAYYAPWGNVAIFYGECQGANGLYELGEVISGTEFIAEMAGEIQIEAVRVHPNDPSA